MDYLYRCWAEINLDNLKFNLAQLKSKLEPGVKILAVVKADAYGHGAQSIAGALEKEVDWFSVASLNEARILRSSEISRPILVFGPTFPELVAQAARLDITQTVLSLEQATALSAAAEKFGVTAKVHIKIDTGMSRFGFSAIDMERTIGEIEQVFALPNLEIGGIYTHFAMADDSTEFGTEYTKRQVWLFDTLLRYLELRGIRFPLVHCCNSAGIMEHPDCHHTMVRAGIALYGYYPDGKPTGELELRPVMAFKARIAQIRSLRQGEFVSYCCTFCAKKDMRLAIISAGYADGVSRALSNRGYVCTPGGIAPIIGRVCMDCLILDITDTIGLEEGDEVILFGGESPISLNNTAASIGTISYELLCNVNRRVPRVYLRDGKVLSVVDYTL